MLESLSLSSLGAGGGGGGGGDSGVFCLFFYAKLFSTELPFPSVILVVVSSPTSSQLGSTSPIDVQLQLFVCRSNFSVFSKVAFGKGGAPSCVR